MVRACALKEEASTLAAIKDYELESLNKRFGTNYRRNHIDNWLAERMAVPKKIREHWIDELIKIEVQIDNEELGEQLRRLMPRPPMRLPMLIKQN